MPNIMPVPISAPIAFANGITTPIFINWFNAIYKKLNEVPTISSGILPPSTTPTSINLFYSDTVAQKLYVSMGTSSPADWIILN
jgi:hypothetical protein